ncbi:hypothetical protein [Flagellimonas sp. 2504JD4-2]
MNMIKTTHLVAQYLAAAGISFLEPKEDDSHTSLKFNMADKSIYTYPLNIYGDTISFDYADFCIRWNSINNHGELNLKWCTHKKVLKWIEDRAKMSGIQKQYKYKFHYKLPYAIREDFVFEITDDRGSLIRLSDIRTLGQLSLESFILNRRLVSDVRIWPHHFDSGAYVPNLGTNKNYALSFGLAIPDKLFSSFYFYMALYDDEGHTSVETKTLEPLKIGKWLDTGFKGAVLPVDEVTNESVATHFFDEAYEIYRRRYDF